MIFRDAVAAIYGSPGNRQPRRPGVPVVVPVKHRHREEERAEHPGEREWRLGICEKPEPQVVLKSVNLACNVDLDRNALQLGGKFCF